jgi:hypothetical protein
MFFGFNCSFYTQIYIVGVSNSRLMIAMAIAKLSKVRRSKPIGSLITKRLTLLSFKPDESSLSILSSRYP